MPLILIKVWKRKLDNICPLPLCACSVLRQFLEKQPLVGSECPECELGRTIARFDRTRVAYFRNVFVVLMPGDGVQGQIGVFVLYFERAGVNGDLNFLFGESSLGIEAPSAKSDIS